VDAKIPKFTWRGWIPTTAMVPDDGVRVLAVHETGRIALTSYNSVLGWAFGEVPTHWVALPDKPGEDRGGG
jgi:hypothetical protein